MTGRLSRTQDLETAAGVLVACTASSGGVAVAGSSDTFAISWRRIDAR